MVDELLSKFQSFYFDFQYFGRYFTIWKQCYRLVSEQEEGEPESFLPSPETMQSVSST